MPGETCSIKVTRVQEIKDCRISNRLSSWHMRPQYLDSARQNASTYLLSLSSNSTICRSTQGNTYELVSRTRVRSSLRPENPETPKSLAPVLKNMVTYPPFTHTFLKWPFLTNFKKYTHTPPPYATKFWCIGRKIEKTLKKCEFAPCWHLTDVPERYARAIEGVGQSGDGVVG